MTTEETFRARLNQKMAEKELSQLYVAIEVGVHHSSVSGWCRGKSMPAAYYLPKLARVLGVSVDWLLGGTPGLPAGIGRQGGKE